ncbi:hypothetical protein CASFOL_013535 [Castilleja foliolosa]|uniref:Uncharacterized protein n=1 Tax=Castilleja foliolosa TaxID=1961234 RepID=A0ABD3DK90_9LAMI
MFCSTYFMLTKCSMKCLNEIEEIASLVNREGLRY